MIEKVKVQIGMRVSTRRDGEGTVIDSNGGHGWRVLFDSNRIENGGDGLDWYVSPTEVWDESGETRLA